jgi:hypothetical protein
MTVVGVRRGRAAARPNLVDVIKLCRTLYGHTIEEANDVSHEVSLTSTDATAASHLDVRGEVLPASETPHLDFRLLIRRGQ